MDTVRIIEYIVSATLFLLGAYSASPFVEIVDASLFMAALSNPPAVTVVGVAYMVVSLVTLLGLVFNDDRWRRWGLMGTFIGFIWMTILRIITFGVLPLTWVWTLCIGAVVGVCFLNERSLRKH